VNALCTSKFPADATCNTIVEPPDLLEGPAAGPDAPLVIGAIFSLAEDIDKALATSAQLAVREINARGGLNGGKKLGLVVCDNGGPGDTAQGDARIPFNNHALDYLAGTLGTPFIVGPLTSSDSIRLITHLKQKAYPTVIISPSATSPDLTDVDDRLHPADPYGLFWRTCPSDKLQGKVLATSVVDKTTIKTVDVLFLNDAYGTGLATVFHDTFGSMQTKLVPYDDVTLNDPTKLAAVAAQAAGDNPDGVLVIALHGDGAVKILTACAGTSLAQKKFFFTDGSKDTKALLDPNLSAPIKMMVAGSLGTAPANPEGKNYDLFKASLLSEFKIDASTFSFLAQAYDAAYVGAYGVVFAAKNGPQYNGLNVADGMSRLSMGAPVNISSTEWLTGQATLLKAGSIDVEGVSGPLKFDASTGEAPGRIEVWGPSADGKSLVTKMVIDPM
jgi:branched-chain amino acid transport system substrate-binding protein